MINSDLNEASKILKQLRHPGKELELIFRDKREMQSDTATVILPEILGQMVFRFIAEILCEEGFGSLSISSEVIQKGLIRVRLEGGPSNQQCLNSTEVDALRAFVCGASKSRLFKLLEQYLIADGD